MSYSKILPEKWELIMASTAAIPRIGFMDRLPFDLVKKSISYLSLNDRLSFQVALRPHSIDLSIDPSYEWTNDASLERIGELGGQLFQIRFNQLTDFTAQGMAAFSRNCSWVRTLEVRAFAPFSGTDEDRIAICTAIASGFPALKRLTLTESTYVNDAVVMAIATHSLQLELLDLSDCSSLTTASIEHLREHSHYLRCLHLGGCHQIGTTPIQRFIERSSLLQTVTFPDRTIWRRPLAAIASTASSSSSSMPTATPLLPRNPHGMKRSRDKDPSTRNTKRRE